MLQNLRESSQGIIAKIIVGFIIITFALWGVDSLVGLASDPGAPITVNDVDITEGEIMNGVELQRRQLIAQMGSSIDPSLLEDNLLRAGVIERLIEQSLLLQSADRKGLAVGKQQLDQIIVNTPDFQVDGRFDQDQFRAILRNAGLTPMMYQDLLRKEILMGQERQAIAMTAFALENEAQAVAAIDRQSRDTYYRILSQQEALSEVSVDETEIETYYRDNQAGFMAAEQVSLEYLELDRASLEADVALDEAALQTQYDQLLANYEASEARDAAHILITISDERTAEQARELAEQLKAEIDAGSDFAELAAANSDDAGSAADGGELGLVEQGVMVGAFEDALFALQAGEVSAPVETEFGYHLIKLNGIETGEAPSFEEVRAELEAEQRASKSEARFVELSEQLADISFSAPDLLDPADQLSLNIKTTAPFSRDGGSDPVAQHPRVLQQAFSDEVLNSGHNSELIELGNDRVVVIRVKEHLPERAQDLSEVKEQIAATLKQQKADALLMEQADQQLADAKGLTLGQLGEAPWQHMDGVTRSEVALDAQLIDTLFNMPKPQDGQLSWATAKLSDGDVAVIGVAGVTPGESLSGDDLNGLRGFLSNRKGQSDYVDLLSSLKSSAEIERR
ncbi:peptidylprolyl isomerase [Motiliproteus coralliicola]|uniref:Periplasmic chaperone PpiD n=1 Tax=Motiliproteus coralliicola TaxID=2283196 RepID=A0A369WXK8_9GAMM|nr:SurA N-terminal domain-containing protein [Motiliproteus coralliicola]RDE24245.1 peptidylprolyl isomerase [Motiliproteus coralliicola]